MFRQSRQLLLDDLPQHRLRIIYQHVRKKWALFFLPSRLSVRQLLLLVIVLTVVTYLLLHGLIPAKFHSWIRIPPKADYYCHRIPPPTSSFSEYYLSFERPQSNRIKNARILVFVETQYSRLGKQIAETLDAVRFKYKIELAGKSLPLLTSMDKGKYSVIIFENLHKYFRMNRWNRDLLDKYCREFGVGIIGFLVNSENSDNHKSASNSGGGGVPYQNVKQIRRLYNLPVSVQSSYQLKDYQLNPNSNIFRIARPGSISLGAVPENNWSVFVLPTNSTGFFPVAQALPHNYIVDTYPGGYKYSDVKKKSGQHNSTVDTQSYQQNLLTTVMQDNGSHDGIRRIIFGNGLNFWLHRLIFLDSLTYLSNGRLSLPLQRYIQIDIDDIFVGERGTRMRPADVDALIDFQQRLQQLIPDFRFNLGFSGKYYHRGFPEENDGDDYIIQHASQFRWFCHMFSHSQAHLTTNMTVIETEMLLNRDFARSRGLPVTGEYTVSPHHSGVFPVHQQLYDAWKKVWKVRVTSTEEYPNLRPAHLRRGFIYKDIMVLPRQTCGLYTHTILLERYPGGREKLEGSIFGGDLFYAFIFNQVNVFMTHQSNYANDRLALYTFESAVKFVQCWTNLQLLTLPPLQLAKRYFLTYTEEKEPIWRNPCDDRRHYNIWWAGKSCFRWPQFLIIGPQKTGSTALYSFLTMHPSVVASRPSATTFEEVQFFSGGQHYLRGIDWYMDFFQLPNDTHLVLPTESPAIAAAAVAAATNNSITGHQKFMQRVPPEAKEGPPYFFEKSSTYFDGEMVPMRAHALLPHAKLIVILLSPLKRAYSWYQHMRAHNHTAALNFTFYEVVSLDVQHRGDLGEKTLKRLKDLRSRCLGPGAYAVHLERWLAYYPPQQIHIIDGDQLRLDPIAVMDRVQPFLKLQPHVDYRQKLRFDAKKGFFCQVTAANGTKCLGKSKGRLYPEMEPQAAKYLHSYFLHHNVVLSKLLNRLRVAIPPWLEAELSTTL